MFSTDSDLARSSCMRCLFKSQANDDTSNGRSALCCQVLKKEPVWKPVSNAPPWPNPRTSRGMPRKVACAEVLRWLIPRRGWKGFYFCFGKRSYSYLSRFTRSFLYGTANDLSRLEDSEGWAEQSVVTGSRVRSVEGGTSGWNTSSHICWSLEHKVLRVQPQKA